MNKPSSFQRDYPLSPRKFWKKVLPSLLNYFIITGCLLFAVIFGSYFLGLDGSIVVNKGIVVLISLFILVFALGIALLRIWYTKVYIQRYYYDYNDNFITIQKGVFAPTEIHVQYQKIQDVYVDQDILDRIMGLYDVHIASATMSSGIAAHIDGVDQKTAEALKDLLLNKIQDGSANKEVVNTPSVKHTSNPTFKFQQKISSETYPINDTWMVTQIISAAIHAFWLSIILIFFGLKIFIETNFVGTFGLVLIMIVLFTIIFIWKATWSYLWKINYYFEFLPDYVLLKTGVISKSESHLPYKTIQDIIVSQSITERIFGLSKVIIQNASQNMVMIGKVPTAVAGFIPLIGQSVGKANELKEVLNKIVGASGNSSNTGL